MKLALWLLDRLDLSDAVVGDIAERSIGKSAWWLWRQTLGALVSDLRQHPWLALRGLALGVLLVRGTQAGLRFVGMDFATWLGRVVYDYLHVGRPTMLLLVMLGHALIVTPCWFATGWLVARWHRIGVVLLLLALVLADQLPQVVRQLTDEFTYQRPTIYSTIHIVGMAISLLNIIAALVLGALAATRRPRTTLLALRRY